MHRSIVLLGSKCRFAPMVAVMALMVGCQGPRPAGDPGGDQQTDRESGDGESAPNKQADGVEVFGEPLGDAPEAALANIVKQPEQFADKAVKVSGTARRVCSRKGCWMELADGDGEQAAACRVRFKNYGFFVPTDSAGAKATVEGTVLLKKVPPKRVAHLEEEGANFTNKNPDGSANELQIVATGVEMIR